MKKLSLIFALFFIVASALQAGDVVTTPAVQLPGIDNSSPEKALNSYWAYMDWQEQAISAFVQSTEYRLDMRFRNQILGGDRLALENWRDRKYSRKSFQREIIRSVQLTDDSAEIVAHIRNVTPNEPAIDPGRLSKKDKLIFSQKASGKIFKYLMEKKDGAWKVMQVFAEQSIYGDKAGWVPAYVIPFAPANTLALDP